MRLGYVIYYVPDVINTVSFYERAFGLKRRFVHESRQYAEMETGGTALAFASEDMVAETCEGFQPIRADRPPFGIEVGLVTDDVPGAYARAVGVGAVPHVAPLTKPWGQVVAYVRDLNGCLVELCSEVGGRSPGFTRLPDSPAGPWPATA